MLTIKKYANGRFYDAVKKKYVTKGQLAALIQKETEIKVLLSKTGTDITKAVRKELVDAPSSYPKAAPQSKSLKQWLGAQVDKQLDRFLARMNFPKKEQVDGLSKTMDTIVRCVNDIQKFEKQKLDALKRAEAAEKEPRAPMVA
jgi:hypothetical protein